MNNGKGDPYERPVQGYVVNSNYSPPVVYAQPIAHDQNVGICRGCGRQFTRRPGVHVSNNLSLIKFKITL